MTNSLHFIVKFISTGMAIWATVYAWLVAFVNHTTTAIILQIPTETHGMSPDEKSAVFAGIAAGIYWSIRVAQALWQMYKVSQSKKLEELNDEA